MKSPALNAVARKDSQRRASGSSLIPVSPRHQLRRSMDNNDVEDTAAEYGGTSPPLCDAFEKLYERGHMLGQGATSKVYTARERNTKKDYAVKVIPRSKVLSNSFSMISKEITILQRLNHNNIIRMHDTIITNENLYIVMELVHGPELFDILVDRKCFSEMEGRRLIHRILDAVAYLHKQHVVHGDIKPENIKLQDLNFDAEIKLLDFGFARLLDTTESTTNSQAGTLGYEAPEMILGGSQSYATDMWAVGVMAYIILCGFPPFFSSDNYEQDQDVLMRYPFWILFNDDTPYLRNAIVRGRIRFPSESWENVTDAAKDFILKLLKVNHADRMTAVQALEHPWFRMPEEIMASVPDQAQYNRPILEPREVLSKFLTARPRKEDLEQHHILFCHSPKSVAVSSRIAAKQHELWLAEKKDQLQSHLKKQRSVTESQVDLKRHVSMPTFTLTDSSDTKKNSTSMTTLPSFSLSTDAYCI